MPALGLGLAALGRPGYVTLNHSSELGGNYDPQLMESRTHSVLDTALEGGIRYFDMARSYGRAEDFFASWLRNRGIAPGQLMVASKWGYTYTAGWSTEAERHEIKDHSLPTFTRQLAESVERLDGFLSLYQIHSVTADGKTLDDNALIDAIARLRERGIRAGFSVSGEGQDVAIRRALEVRRDGERVFDSVQATWNLLERGAESALVEAKSAGMKVVVKEVLANGRLAGGERREARGAKTPNRDEAFYAQVERAREIAKAQGTPLELLAYAMALARPWADFVLTGAATVNQVRSTISAKDLPYDADLDEQLREIVVSPADYWRARSSFKWN